MEGLVDSHAHLTGDEIFPDVESVLKGAQLAGIQTILNICTDTLSLERGLELSKRHPWVFQAAATTPHDAEKEGDAVFDVMASAARNGFLKAVGETGLDYYYAHSCREVQQKLFRRYLELALECQLPVVVHCREAFADFFEIIDHDFRLTGGKHAPGVLHCFTGTVQDAQKLVERDWMVSLSGIVTFKKSVALQEVARMIPLENLLIETDAPYLAPQSHRGKRNEPAFLVETASFIASLKGISLQELAAATSANASRLFNFTNCKV